MLTFVRNTV